MRGHGVTASFHSKGAEGCVLTEIHKRLQARFHSEGTSVSWVCPRFGGNWECILLMSSPPGGLPPWLRSKRGLVGSGVPSAAISAKLCWTKRSSLRLRGGPAWPLDSKPRPTCAVGELLCDLLVSMTGPKPALPLLRGVPPGVLGPDIWSVRSPACPPS